MHALWAALIALGASTAGTVAFLILGSCAIAYIATHPPRKRVKQTPAEFGAAYEEVSFASQDGVTLAGWYLPSCRPEREARGAVILCHGMAANREEMLPWAAPLWEQGFSVLLFDFRGVGESGGDLCTAGWQETLDLRAAVDYLVSRPDAAAVSIGVFGFSMGGATAILAAADDTRIRAVATHGAYATLDRAISQRCRRHFGPLGPIATWATTSFGRAAHWFPVAPSRIAPINAVSRLAPRPLLILHGSRDKIIHPADARDLHDAAGEPKQLHVLPRSGHRRIHRTLRKEAVDRVVAFFCKHLDAFRPAPPEPPASALDTGHKGKYMQPALPTR